MYEVIHPENRVLRRIFVSKRDKVTGEWRKLHNEELNDLYPLPTIVWVTYTGFWWGQPRERDHWGDQGVDGRIILGWIFNKWDVGIWTGLSWLWIETGGGHL
jgi:hypothetical protein